jgi:hypothetical protein|nr:MAG TPA: hypothetical protein [Ackermannviridae sp.]
MKRNVVVAAVLAGFCGVVLAGAGFIVNSTGATATTTARNNAQQHQTQEDRWELEVMKLSVNLQHAVEAMEQWKEVCTEPDTSECQKETAKMKQLNAEISQMVEVYHKHYPFRDLPSDVLENLIRFTISTSGL